MLDYGLVAAFWQHGLLHLLPITPREEDLRVLLRKGVNVPEMRERDAFPDPMVLFSENVAFDGDG